MKKDFLAISYYSFKSVPEPHQMVVQHKRHCAQLNMRGRVYISDEGINGQISVVKDEAEPYMQWLSDQFPGMEFKIQGCDEHAFAKMTIKYRKQLVAFDTKVDLRMHGKHLEPREWKEKLEERDSKRILIDVRNEYESMVGHFEGAILPKLDTFRDFPAYIQDLKQKVDPQKTEIMMYCTGGIRCEYFSSLMLKEGFQKIFQLKGGVINYGNQEGKKHWKGKLFVFDDRLVVPIVEDNDEVISTCYHCETKTDVYYNCANMDCNELFISCKNCLEKYKGCCCTSCLENGRVRDFDQSETPKPFRRLSHEQKTHFSSRQRNAAENCPHD